MTIHPNLIALERSIEFPRRAENEALSCAGELSIARSGRALRLAIAGSRMKQSRGRRGHTALELRLRKLPRPAVGASKESCFVLEVSGRAVLAFTAASRRSALRRARETWLLEELGRLRSLSRPVLNPGDAVSVRDASSAEAMTVVIERDVDAARGEDAKYGFAFLIPVDPAQN